ncbi:MAG: AIR synthase-related protein, partial [Vulcanimicrobiaceae bacterium]
GIADAVRWMTTLNAAGARAMIANGAHAATDITGFGLLGHAGSLARASQVRLRIHARAVPALAGALDLIERDIVPAGTRRNAREHAEYTAFAPGLSDGLELLLSDAQTSGGLLIALPPERVAALRAELEAGGGMAALIGSVEAGSGIIVD